MSYPDRVETDWAFRVRPPLGTHVPFLCAASGKVFLASLETRQRKAFARSLDLDQRMPSTITDPDNLLRELSIICKRGFATDNEEFMDGMVAIAVPVLDMDGRFLAAIACHGPKVRLSPAMLRGFAPELNLAGKKMQAALT